MVKSKALLKVEKQFKYQLEINKSLQERIKQLESQKNEELVTKYENTIKVLEEKLVVF